MKPVHILLVEDNEGDILLTTEALAEGKLENKLSVTRDGGAAIDFLNRRKPFEDQSLPDLILLDLKMPKVDGIEVLRKLKGDERRKLIPVVVFTSSKEDRDVLESYQLGANAYIVKPVDFDEFVKAIAEIGLFWLILNQAPK